MNIHSVQYVAPGPDTCHFDEMSAHKMINQTTNLSEIYQSSLELGADPGIFGGVQTLLNMLKLF